MTEERATAELGRRRQGPRNNGIGHSFGPMGTPTMKREDEESTAAHALHDDTLAVPPSMPMAPRHAIRVPLAHAHQEVIEYLVDVPALLR